MKHVRNPRSAAVCVPSSIHKCVLPVSPEPPRATGSANAKHIIPDKRGNPLGGCATLCAWQGAAACFFGRVHKQPIDQAIAQRLADRPRSHSSGQSWRRIRGMIAY